MTTQTLLALADRPTVRVSPVIVSGCPDAHQVWLDRGAQHFRVGEYLETKQEADAYADMLRRTLAAPQVEMVSEFPSIHVNVPDPHNSDARIVGFRIFPGDPWYGERGLSEPLTALQAALNARAGGDAKDAERYRYLRRPEAWNEGYLHVNGAISAIFVSDGQRGHATDGEKLDAAIDAALASQAVGVKDE